MDLRQSCQCIWKNSSMTITEVIDGPNIEICRGVRRRSHTVLAVEGCSKCSSCDKAICKECQDSIDGSIYCLPCYAAEALVPESDVDEGQETVSTMKETLKTIYAVEEVNGLTIDEVMNVYALRENASSHFKRIVDSALFSLHTSKSKERDSNPPQNYYEC